MGRRRWAASSMALLLAACGAGRSVPSGATTTVGASIVVATSDVDTSDVATSGPCTTLLGPGSTTRTIDRPEGARTYDLHMPSIENGARRPLIVDFHGTGGTPALQEAVTHFGEIGSTTGGWITATPQALGPMPAWAVPGAIPGDDIGFVEAMVDELVADACVDPHRVFATGISSGAAMSAFVGCESTRFAGVAPVAGVNLVRRCEGEAPVSLVAFHGTLDRYVPMDGLPGWDGPDFADLRKFYRGDLMATVESWARRDGCATEATTTSMGPMTTRYEWPGCRNGTKVVLYLSDGAGHTHPGATFPPGVTPSVGDVATDIDATEVIAEEFGLVDAPNP